MVGAEGFEPPTLCSQSRCATRLRYAPTLFIVSYAQIISGCGVRISELLSDVLDAVRQPFGEPDQQNHRQQKNNSDA